MTSCKFCRIVRSLAMVGVLLVIVLLANMEGLV